MSTSRALLRRLYERTKDVSDCVANEGEYGVDVWQSSELKSLIEECRAHLEPKPEQPVEDWAAESDGVLELVDSLEAHRDECPGDSFRRLCYTSLRQFLESEGT